MDVSVGCVALDAIVRRTTKIQGRQDGTLADDKSSSPFLYECYLSLFIIRHYLAFFVDEDCRSTSR